MRKTLWATAILLAIHISVNAQSQNFRPFKVDFLLGYATPNGNLSNLHGKGGVAISLEPKYNISDNLAIGLKGEVAALEVVSNSTSTSDEYSARTVGSVIVTGEYSFGNVVRPFLGAGLGIYNFGSVDVVTNSSNNSTQRVNGGSNFGFAPRIGLQIGHFRLAIEDNIVKDNNYLSFKAGVTFGGGRR
ncbi:outer membrane beta-barrel protein [Spirosoma sp. SC4-14]|uniref:outer membrane beta-barrel protein n=1 Tax=Spirosoma sp. SC4-14 TaxID=3128900 RepID=UPI0030D15094